LALCLEREEDELDDESDFETEMEIDTDDRGDRLLLICNRFTTEGENGT
jgi:hypothetical protein